MSDKLTESIDPKFKSFLDAIQSILFDKPYKGDKISDFRLMKLHRLFCFFPNSFLQQNSPEEVQTTVKKKKEKFQIKKLTQLQTIADICELFNANDIDFMVLKGVALNDFLHGNKLVRTSRDIDILIKPSDLEKANHILLQNNYKRSSPSFEYSPNQLKSIIKEFDQFVYIYLGNKTSIELHWKLFRNEHFFPIPEEQIWQKTLFIKIGEIQFRTLPIDILSIFLSIHGAMHRWDILMWLVDIHHLVQKMTSDEIESAVALSKKYNCTDAFVMGFYLAQELLDTKIPSIISVHFSTKVKSMAKTTIPFITDEIRVTNAANTSKIIRYSLRLVSNWRGKVDHLKGYPLYSYKYVKLPFESQLIYQLAWPYSYLREKLKKNDGNDKTNNLIT